MCNDFYGGANEGELRGNEHATLDPLIPPGVGPDVGAGVGAGVGSGENRRQRVIENGFMNYVSLSTILVFHENVSQ